MGVTCGAQRECSSGAGAHRVIGFVVGLEVGTELKLAVAVEVELGAQKNRAVSAGHSVVRGEGVDPKNNEVEELHDEAIRKLAKREEIVDPPRTIFESADGSRCSG